MYDLQTVLCKDVWKESDLRLMNLKSSVDKAKDKSVRKSLVPAYGNHQANKLFVHTIL